MAIGFGLLGAWAVTIAGNLEGFFEVLHSRGLGSDAFWGWLDIKDLAQASVTGSWYPTDNWWWWRASRVIHDKDPLGRSVEVIDEFPFFSFLLGDMHPHVLALPFVLLALGLALNLVFAARDSAAAAGGRRQAGLAAGAVRRAGLGLPGLCRVHRRDRLPEHLGPADLLHDRHRRVRHAASSRRRRA